LARVLCTVTGDEVRAIHAGSAAALGRAPDYVQFYPPAPRARYGNALSAVVALAETAGKYVGLTNTPTETLERLVADANGRYVLASNIYRRSAGEDLFWHSAFVGGAWTCVDIAV